ncbi:MAG: MBL fold metallo-hydrolase [Eubacteriales bacterium]
MEFSVLPLGEISTNCIIVKDTASNKAAVIDPAADGEKLAKTLARHNLELEYILLTHGHWDHILGVESLRVATKAPVYIHKADLLLPLSMTKVPISATHYYDDGDQLQLGNLRIHVIHTPGHTPGSVCLQIGNHLFTGDTLFEGSCGRIDFPLGSAKEMKKSLRKLGQIDTDFAFTPGHGDGGTLHSQRTSNPYMREALK